jgi:thiol-disulfide isomerase/thioredoxin
MSRHTTKGEHKKRSVKHPRRSVKKTSKSYKKNTLSKRRYVKHGGNGEEPVVIGLIYADWCPHCQNMKPDWNEMKNDIHQKYDDHYDFVEIEDGEQDKQERIAELETKMNGGKIEASGFPTIFKLNGGNIEYYSGDRDKKSMEQWVTAGHKGGYQRAKLIQTRRVLTNIPISKSYPRTLTQRKKIE